LIKKVIYVVLFVGSWANAQTALYNSGNLQIHQEGRLGLHIDLINDGVLDDNLGLAGFYGDLPLSVSGAFAPTFFDLEIENPDHVFLATGINAVNSTNFMLGNFETPRNATDNYLNFTTNAIATNSGDLSKVDGYAAITEQQSFTFPVGDAVQLRPLVLNSDGVNSFAKCAYFFEDPNSPSTFATNFSTGVKEESLGPVSTVEFWRLEGGVPSTVQLSWNERSTISLLTDDPTTLTIVGWSKATNQWESLVGAPAMGDITQGFVSSQSFVPDDYEVLTLASSLGEAQTFISVDNFLVTPNGDGNNDSFIIPELAQSPNNALQIFDRFGLKVFEMENYTDEFRGFANTGTIIMGKEKGLPIGVYFFIVEMKDLNLDFQGFLYLAR
jgi:gliding motility-associated-like protein